jgi:hypothetical protein
MIVLVLALAVLLALYVSLIIHAVRGRGKNQSFLGQGRQDAVGSLRPQHQSSMSRWSMRPTASRWRRLGCPDVDRRNDFGRAA